MKFKEFLAEEKEIFEQEEKLHVLMYMLENIETLNESTEEQIYEAVKDKLHGGLNKVGLKLHKGKGILDYIKTFATGTGKVFLHMIKGDAKKAKELIKKIEKEDILDFLYKLDLGTLHLISGPLHTIDAWTGWDLAVNLKSKMERGEGIVDTIKKGIKTVRDKLATLYKAEPDRIKNYNKSLDDIETTLA